jgi:hypothetical protein
MRLFHTWRVFFMGNALVESDGWSLELRRQAAEAMMVCDPQGAFDRLAPSLGYGTEAVPDEYTVRGIAAAWWARMRPEDDPRFAFAFGARMADPGSAPVVLFNILRGRGHPAAVDGALAALERTASRGALQVPYLYALLAALGDRRAVGAPRRRPGRLRRSPAAEDRPRHAQAA